MKNTTHACAQTGFQHAAAGKSRCGQVVLAHSGARVSEQVGAMFQSMKERSGLTEGSASPSIRAAGQAVREGDGMGNTKASEGTRRHSANETASPVLVDHHATL